MEILAKRNYYGEKEKTGENRVCWKNWIIEKLDWNYEKLHAIFSGNLACGLIKKIKSFIRILQSAWIWYDNCIKPITITIFFQYCIYKIYLV